jgi:hypothetical protein
MRLLLIVLAKSAPLNQKASERSRGVRWPYVKELANGQDTGIVPPDATAQNAMRGLKPSTPRQLSSPNGNKSAGG